MSDASMMVRVLRKMNPALSGIRNYVLDYLDELEHGQLLVQDPYGERTLGTADHRSARITINDPMLYPRLLMSGSVGLGETFADGWWETDQLDDCLELLALNRDRWMGLSSYNPLSLVDRFVHWTNENSVEGSRKNISEHYDLGNEFYDLFLDETMTYSCAVYGDSSWELSRAQRHKIDRVCRELDLSAGKRVLEIGTGWGGFAAHAAKNYGCEIVTTTISEKQHEYTRQLLREEGLQDRVTVLKRDYRNLDGDFDRIVSIEMLEAVGDKYLPTFFERLDDLLKPGGRVLLQSIHMANQYYDTYRNTVDFIQRYIFPGGHLPSLNRIQEELSETTLSLVNLEEIGDHYVKTLEEWKGRFLAKRENMLRMGFDEYFLRLWRYYFSYCRAGFASGLIGDVKLTLDRTDRFERSDATVSQG